MRWLAYFINLGFSIYRWIIIARFIMSWMPNIDYYHPAVRFIYTATEPILAPFRRILPTIGGIDFSPILVFLVIDFIRGAIVQALYLL